METGSVKIERGNEYYSMHNNTALYYFAAYNELIDNAIDNNATEIRFDYTEKSVTIIDNGTGIKDTKQDMERVLRMYKSSNLDNLSKIGQYGVGLKDATMRLGKAITIISKAPGCSVIQIDVPWKDIFDYENDAKFKIISNDEIKQGTSITIWFDNEDTTTPPAPDKRSFKYYDKLVESGKLRIINNGVDYIPQSEPTFMIAPQIISNEIFNKKKFDITIGILDSKKSHALSGFYVYSTETLRYFNVHETRLDGDLEARDGLYVCIGLYGTKTDWPVDKNKRGILNIDIVSEYLKIYNIFQKWEQKLYNSKKSDTLESIQNTLSEVFGFNQSAIGEEKRNKNGNNKGTVEPVDSGKERLKATQVREHEWKKVIRKYGGSINGLSIEECHFNTAYKYLSISKSNYDLVIRLNKENELINQLLLNKTINTKDVLTHLLFIAMQANLINPTEMRFSLVDDLFTQHEYFQK